MFIHFHVGIWYVSIGKVLWRISQETNGFEISKGIEKFCLESYIFSGQESWKNFLPIPELFGAAWGYGWVEATADNEALNSTSKLEVNCDIALKSDHYLHSSHGK